MIKHEELLEIILAANYLNIQPLLELGCAYVATLVKDKTMEEIKLTFKVTKDMTKEDEQLLRQNPENKWAEED